MAKGVKKQVVKKQDGLTNSSKAVIREEKSNNKNLSSNKNIDDSNNNPLSIRLTNQNLMEAVVFSEILGKPKCKRRGRCR